MKQIEVRPQDIPVKRVERNADWWTKAMLNAECFIECPDSTSIEPFQILGSMKKALKEAKMFEEQKAFHQSKDIYRLAPTIGVWLLVASILMGLILFFGSCMAAYAWSPLLLGPVAIFGLVAMKINDRKRQLRQQEIERELTTRWCHLEEMVDRLMQLNWFSYLGGIQAYSTPIRQHYQNTRKKAQAQNDSDALEKSSSALKRIDELIMEWKKDRPKGVYLLTTWDDFQFDSKHRFNP